MMEQKYQLGNEYGSILWDITAMLQNAADFPVVTCDVQALAAANPFHGNEAHIMETDLSLPLVVVELRPGVEKLIDGNHRLQKALRLGMTTIPVYRLTFQQHRRYIVDYDEATYQQVVRHWTA